MLSYRTLSVILCSVALALPLAAQESQVQYGIAGGALSYPGGRQEQAIGAVVRWYVMPWLSIATEPTVVRAREPAFSATAPSTSRSGLTDVPVELTVSRGLGGPLGASVAAGFAVTLPVGDTAHGLGSGEMGSSISGGLGLVPIERSWVWIGAGRSLTRFSMQSAFRSGTGWGDISGGYSLTDRVGVSAGYSTDLGAVDSTLGRSTSVSAGASVSVGRGMNVTVNSSRRLRGSAPDWSIAIGVGTAFPYLTHLGPGTPSETLQNTFGGGTHGIGNGGTSGSSGSSSSGKCNGNSRSKNCA